MEIYKVYHFVTTNEMKNTVIQYSIDMKLSISKAINHIINVMIPVLDYQHLQYKESTDYTYTQLGAETEIKFRIDRNLYRKLKNIQGTIHTFSVAVIVRKMINLFFKYKSKRKLNKLKRVLKYVENRINKVKNLFISYRKKHYEVHMCDKDTNMEYISLIFSRNYTLLGFQFFP